MPTLQLPAYTPALYLPGHYGRYRSYPFDTTTPIPGAGYDARLRWGEQVLNLDGAPAGKRFVYGNYRRDGGVPLLGLGQSTGIAIDPAASANVLSRFVGIAQRIWTQAAPTVSYGAASTTVTYPSGTPPINYDALVEYAKITAVGTFVGIPVAALLGYALAPKRAKTSTANSRRRRRRARR